MDIIKSNKGCDKLCYNGFTYVVKHIGKSKITWRCSKRSAMKCTGELYTNHQKEDPVSKSDHNHFGDNDKVDVAKALCVMKEQTKAGLSKPLEVYAETISKLDGDTRAKMPVEDSVKRTLRNQRSKLNPVEPNSLENLVIDGSYLN